MDQLKNQKIYIEKNTGNFYVGVVETDNKHEFERCSCDLEMYQASIKPVLIRPEVDTILNWIREDTDEKYPERVGLLFGNAGIGKSVVMHDLLLRLKGESDTIVLGLKSDQFEFVDAEDLSKKLHIAKPLEDILSILVCKYHRVVLLIDQIDALSLSLSANRTPLRTILRIIHQIKNLEHIRIVVSCRPFDLENDNDLKQFKANQTWELREFRPEEVTDILHQHHYDIEVDQTVLHFLGNPLHLHLFLTVYQSGGVSFPLTIENLYDQLWRRYISGVDEHVVKRANLLNLLDKMVNYMHEHQELTIHSSKVETLYSAEIDYLLHHEILTINSSRQLQFFHQTMFDYVYARRFIETGKDLLQQLQHQHQGLFVRSEVKSIITFLRSIDPTEYKKVIKHILRDTNEKGNPVFRFHLQALVLSIMTYYEKPINEEISLVKKLIVQEYNHLVVLMDAIHTADWFLVICSVIDENGGWNELDERLRRKMMDICYRVLYSTPETILDYLLELLQHGGEVEKKYVSDLFEYYHLDLPSEQMKKIYNLITTSRYPLQHCCILENLAISAPEFVENELMINVQIQLSENTHGLFEKIKLSDAEAFIYEKLEEAHPERIVDFYLKLLGLTVSSSLRLLPGYEIMSTYEFSFFQRKDKGHFAFNDYIQVLTNTVLDRLEDDISQKNKFHDDLLKQLVNTDNEIFVFIGLYCYALNPQHYSEEIYRVLTSRKVLANAPSWVVYQAAELLRVSFSSFPEEQQKAIIDIILNIKDKDEVCLISKEWVKEHLIQNFPLFPIGRRKGTLLNMLPFDELNAQFPKAYHKLLELQRKYNSKILKNSSPFSMSCGGGWNSLGAERAKKMDNNAWKKSMKVYTSNKMDPFTNIPTLQGQVQLFQDETKLNPLEKYPLIDDIITDETIPLPYPIYGMKGLLEAGQLDLAENIFIKIVEVLGTDINTNYRSFNLLEFLFAINGFFERKVLLESILGFLCRVVMEAKDDSTFTQKSGFDICMWGFNHPRGYAANKLIRYYAYPQYAPRIFDLLNLIADNATIHTRAAILQDYACLIHLDKKRSLDVFIKLMYDYHPLLMSMPVHRNNPLIYFIDYAFDSLVPIFEKALEIVESQKSQVIILWLAWTKTHNEKAKTLLDSMCERSELARISLLQYFHQMRRNFDSEASSYLCKLMQYAPYSDKIAKECDNTFRYLSLVPLNIQRAVSQCFVSSEMSKGEIYSFYSFLATYALKDPIRSLDWLIQVLEKNKPKYNRSLNLITDALFQSYNGINEFDDEDNLPLLEKAMDTLDSIMENTDNNYLITKYINQFDNK